MFSDICNRLSHPARERVVGQEVNLNFLRVHGDRILCVRVVLVSFHILPNIAGQNLVAADFAVRGPKSMA